MRRLALALGLLALTAVPATAAPPPKVLGLEDSGTTVTLVKGQRLRIELSVCYSCGYSWGRRDAPAPRVRSSRPPGAGRRVPAARERA